MRPPITPFFVLRYTLGQPEGWAFLLTFCLYSFLFWIAYESLQSDFLSLDGILAVLGFGIMMFIISCISLYLSIKKVLKVNFLVQNWNATVAIFSHQEISESYEGDRRLFFKYIVNGKELETSLKRVYPSDYDFDDIIIVDKRDYENQILLYNPKNSEEVIYINEEPHAIRDYFLDNGLIQL